jgi:CBS domain containing-hemolysin-like protein
MQNTLLVIVALLLVLLNGFFVAAEFSLVKLRQTRIRTIAQTHGWRGRILATVHGQLDVYLSACQLGITLASLGLGWVGEPAFARLLDPLFEQIGISAPEVIHSISFAFAFVTISFLHIVAGELAPKSMAIRHPEAIGLFSAVPLYSFYWMMYPAIWLLNNSANLVLRIAGLSGVHSHDSQYSDEELKLILRSSRSNEHFNKDEWNVLAKALDFSKLEVSDLMRPIHEVAALSQSQSVQQNLALICATRYSRYPYFNKEGSEVLGVLHLKDLFLAEQQGQTIAQLETFLRPIQYVSSDTPALDLFRSFTKGAPHFAMVGQRGEKPQGFITFDNLLSAMIGEIRDEFRQNESDWQKLDDGSLVGRGSLPIFSLERILGIDIENEELELEDVDSIGGLIMAQLRDIPKTGQTIQFNKFAIVVLEMDEACIVRVQVIPHRE